MLEAGQQTFTSQDKLDVIDAADRAADAYLAFEKAAGPEPSAETQAALDKMHAQVMQFLVIVMYVGSDSERKWINLMLRPPEDDPPSPKVP